MKPTELVEKAIEALEHAYIPYSKFPVGAALLTQDGKVLTGCNIENAAYSVTCCAERVAIFKAISEGIKDFTALAVVADTKDPVSPCGSCRQVMAEFFPRNLPIYVANMDKKVLETTVEQLLPRSFSKEDLDHT